MARQGPSAAARTPGENSGNSGSGKPDKEDSRREAAITSAPSAFDPALAPDPALKLSLDVTALINSMLTTATAALSKAPRSKNLGKLVNQMYASWADYYRFVASSQDCSPDVPPTSAANQPDPKSIYLHSLALLLCEFATDPKRQPPNSARDLINQISRDSKLLPSHPVGPPESFKEYLKVLVTHASQASSLRVPEQEQPLTARPELLSFVLMEVLKGDPNCLEPKTVRKIIEAVTKRCVDSISRSVDSLLLLYQNASDPKLSSYYLLHAFELTAYPPPLKLLPRANSVELVKKRVEILAKAVQDPACVNWTPDAVRGHLQQLSELHEPAARSGSQKRTGVPARDVFYIFAAPIGSLVDGLVKGSLKTTDPGDATAQQAYAEMFSSCSEWLTKLQSSLSERIAGNSGFTSVLHEVNRVTTQVLLNQITFLVDTGYELDAENRAAQLRASLQRFREICQHKPALSNACLFFSDAAVSISCASSFFAAQDSMEDALSAWYDAAWCVRRSLAETATNCDATQSRAIVESLAQLIAALYELSDDTASPLMEGYDDIALAPERGALPDHRKIAVLDTALELMDRASLHMKVVADTEQRNSASPSATNQAFLGPTIYVQQAALLQLREYSLMALAYLEEALGLFSPGERLSQPQIDEYKYALELGISTLDLMQRSSRVDQSAIAELHHRFVQVYESITWLRPDSD